MYFYSVFLFRIGGCLPSQCQSYCYKIKLLGYWTVVPYDVYGSDHWQIPWTRSCHHPWWSWSQQGAHSAISLKCFDFISFSCFSSDALPSGIRFRATAIQNYRQGLSERHICEWRPNWTGQSSCFFSVDNDLWLCNDETLLSWTKFCFSLTSTFWGFG
jgi:hypothetical protein